MKNRFHLYLIFILAVCMNLGCNSSQEDSCTGLECETGCTGPQCSGIPAGQTGQTGQAQIKFTPKFGQYSLPIYRAWQTLVMPSIKGSCNIITMFCALDDMECKSPLKTIETAADPEHPIQQSVGPEISLSGIEPGEYNMFVFCDTVLPPEYHDSYEELKARGNVKQEPWGGLTSMLDMCLIAKDDASAENHKPAAASWKVTVPAQGMLELGDMYLSHYREINISPDIPYENGRIAVVTSDGIRTIDMNTMSVENDGGSGMQQLVDKNNQPIADKTCGMIDTGGDVIWVLFGDKAVPYDVRQRKQLGNGATVKFSLKTACSGIYHEAGGKKYLYVANKEGAKFAKEGMWYADVSDVLNGNDVEATYLDQTNDDKLYKNGIDGLAAYNNTLYLAYTPNASRTGLAVLPPCKTTDLCLFKADIDADGKPHIKKDSSGKYDTVILNYTEPASLIYKGETTPITLNCGNSVSTMDTSTTSLYVANNKWLMMGACNGLFVFDVTDGDKQVDYNGSDEGNGMLVTALGGRVPNSYVMGPDGYLWVMFKEKSAVHTYIHEGPISDNHWMSDDRQAALAIDLSGARPELAEEYNKDNIDGFKGFPENSTKTLSDIDTPEIDPGVPMRFIQLRQYVRGLNSTIQTAPYPFATNPFIAVGEKTLWLIGGASNETDSSGLGQAAQPAVFSLKDRAGIIFPAKTDDDVYRVFTNGADSSKSFGFPFDDEKVYATHGIKYIKK